MVLLCAKKADNRVGARILPKIRPNGWRFWTKPTGLVLASTPVVRLPLHCQKHVLILPVSLSLGTTFFAYPRFAYELLPGQGNRNWHVA